MSVQIPGSYKESIFRTKGRLHFSTLQRPFNSALRSIEFVELNCSSENLFNLLLRIKADASIDITVGILTEGIIVTRQDGIQNDACQRGDCERSQSDGSASYSKGKAAGESKTAYQDNRSDDQIS